MLPNPLGMTIGLMQGTPIDGFPMSAVPLVTVTFSDEEGELLTPVLYLTQARRLGRLLAHYAAVGRRARMPRRP